MKAEAKLVDDRAIVDEVVAGDTERFSVLVRRHQRAVYALGYSFFHNHDDAEDFTQEVFLKAFRNLASFRGQSRFSTWLYRIAYNTAVNGVKRRRSYLSLSEEIPGSNQLGPENMVLRLTAAAAVKEAITELPERYRLCVDLYFFYNLSYPEIETVTGYPVNTIKSHVFRAKQSLRYRLRDYAEGGLS